MQDRDREDSLLARLDLRGRVREIMDGIGSVQIGQRKQDSNSLLSRLTSVDFEAVHADVASRRTNGTGKWLLETHDFLHWMENSSVLWCQGIPGCGKTTLASIVVDTLRGLQRNDSIYCDYRSLRLLQILLVVWYGNWLRRWNSFPNFQRTVLILSRTKSWDPTRR